jgi:hypothetical protein
MRGSSSPTVHTSATRCDSIAQNNNRIYLPIGITLIDRDCSYSGELLELMSATDDSDGSGSSPYSSAFSTGFGSGGFN